MEKVIKVIRYLAIKFNEIFFIVGKKLLKMQKYNHILQLGMIFVYVIIIPLCLCLKSLLRDSLPIIIILCIIFFYICMFICYSSTILLSTIGFLCYGIMHYIVFIFMFIVLCAFISEKNIIQLILMFAFSIILWWTFSLLANNKVAQLVNGLFSTLFGLLVLLKDFITSLLYDDLLLKLFKISSEDFSDVWNVVMTPLLVINITALMLCSIKGYWIEKYNDCNDITAEMLPENEFRLHILDKIKEFIKF